MGRLRVLSGREVCPILAQHGFEQVRQRGGHVVMQKRMHDSTITVPVPDHPELRTGTLLPSFASPVLPVPFLTNDRLNGFPEPS